MIYLYYDKNYVLKEIINDGLTTRQGNVNANTILIYVEQYPVINGGSSVFETNNGKSNEEVFSTSELITTTIPYDKFRDTKYFKDYVEYNFFKVDVPNEVLQTNGLVKATFRLIGLNVFYTLGMFVFNVENSVVKSDNNITQSQYDYLLSLITYYSNISSNAVVHTLEEISDGQSAQGQELNRLIISTYNDVFKVFQVVSYDEGTSLFYKLIYEAGGFVDLEGRVEKLESQEETYNGSVEQFIEDYKARTITNGNYTSLNSNINLFSRTIDTNHFVYNGYLTKGTHKLYLDSEDESQAKRLLTNVEVENNGYYKVDLELTSTSASYEIEPISEIALGLGVETLSSKNANTQYQLRGEIASIGLTPTMQGKGIFMYNGSDNTVVFYGVSVKNGDNFRIYDTTDTSWYPSQGKETFSNSRVVDITFNTQTKEITIANSVLDYIYLDELILPFKAIVSLRNALVLTSDEYDRNKNIILLSYTNDPSEIVIEYPLKNVITRTSQLENDSGFITKDVNNLTNYYKKSETLSTSEIKNYVGENSYTKGEIDDKITELDNTITEVSEREKALGNSLTNNYYTKTDSNARYYTQSQVNTKLNDYVLTSTLTSDYYDKDYIDAKFLEVGVDYTNYVLSQISKVETKLGDYVLTSYLEANYPTNEDLTTNMGALTVTIQGWTKSYAYSKTDIDSKLADLTGFKFEKVETLPDTGKPNVIYLVPKQTTRAATTQDIYEEYYWDATTNSYEFLGTTAMDLSNYYNKSEIDDKLSDYTTTLTFTTTLTNQYYNKQQIDGKLNNYIQAGALNNYYTKLQIDAKLTNDYYTSAQVDTKLTNYVLTTTLNNYYDRTSIDTKLGDYVLSTTLTTNYYDSSTIDSKLATYITSSQVDSKLADYYTKTETDDEFNGLKIRTKSVRDSGNWPIYGIQLSKNGVAIPNSELYFRRVRIDSASNYLFQTYTSSSAVPETVTLYTKPFICYEVNKTTKKVLRKFGSNNYFAVNGSKITSASCYLIDYSDENNPEIYYLSKVNRITQSPGANDDIGHWIFENIDYTNKIIKKISIDLSYDRAYNILTTFNDYEEISFSSSVPAIKGSFYNNSNGVLETAEIKTITNNDFVILVDDNLPLVSPRVFYKQTDTSFTLIEENVLYTITIASNGTWSKSQISLDTSSEITSLENQVPNNLRYLSGDNSLQLMRGSTPIGSKAFLPSNNTTVSTGEITATLTNSSQETYTNFTVLGEGITEIMFDSVLWGAETSTHSGNLYIKISSPVGSATPITLPIGSSNNFSIKVISSYSQGTVLILTDYNNSANNTIKRSTQEGGAQIGFRFVQEGGGGNTSTELTLLYYQTINKEN